MVTDDGHVKITDFGIAKALIDSETVAFRTATGATIGTPGLHVARAGDGRGRRPLDRPLRDRRDRLRAVVGLGAVRQPRADGDPARALPGGARAAGASARPDVPAPIAAWVDALLAKSPADRPPSAQAAWEELEEHLLECAGARWRRSARLEGEPGTARPDRPPDHARPVPERGVGDLRDAGDGGGRPAARHVTGRRGRHATRHAAAPRPGRRTAVRRRRRRPRRRHHTAARHAAPPPHRRRRRRPPPPPRRHPRAARRHRPAPGDAGAPTAPLSRPTPPLAASPPRAPAGAGLAAVAVVGVVLALTLPGEQETPTDAASTAAPADGPSRSATDWMRAVHVVSYEPEGLAKPGFVDAVRRAKADGATHVVLRPMLMTELDRRRRSSRTSPTRRPTRRSWPASRPPTARACRRSSSPISSPRATTRARTSPSDPDAFFDGLRASASRRGRTSRPSTAPTRSSSARCSRSSTAPTTPTAGPRCSTTRATRCGCRVTYSAEDVEGAERIEFWDAADAIGVNPLAALTDEPTNDVETLKRAWDPLKRADAGAQRPLEQARLHHRPRLPVEGGPGRRADLRGRRASRPRRRRPRSTRPPSAPSRATTGSAASAGTSSTATARSPRRTTTRSPASRPKRSCAPGRLPAREVAASSSAASSGRQITRSGRYGCARLYSSGAPSMREACRPCASATPTGAAESHSHCPPACT